MTEKMTHNTREVVRSCAAYGALAWTAYGVVECLFSIIMPWIVHAGFNYTPLHRGFTVLLFITYPVLGMIMGGISGMAFAASNEQGKRNQKTAMSVLLLIVITLTLSYAGYFVIALLGIEPVFSLILGSVFGMSLGTAAGGRDEKARVQSPFLFSVLGTSTVVFTLTANYLILWSHGAKTLRILPLVAVAFFIVMVILYSVFSVNWFKKLRVLTNQWVVCILLIGQPWMLFEALSNYSRAVKMTSALGYPVAVIVIALLIQKTFLKSRARHTSFVPVQSFTITAFAAIVVLAFSFIPEQSPRIQDNNKISQDLNTEYPHIILIVLDTVRADHMSLYGYERDTTPHINKIAQHSTIYARSIASGAMTLSTHASIFTGMYAKRHNAHCTESLPAGVPLDDEYTTIAEILSEQGYVTAGIASNFGYLSPVFKLDQGFYYFDNRVPIHFYTQTKPYYVRQNVRNLLKKFSSPYVSEKKYRSAEEINGEVFSFLDNEKRSEKPFFLFVNYMDAHRPYIPPPPFDTLYPGKDEAVNTDLNNRLTREVNQLTRTVTKKERRHLISQYDGSIAYLDSHIGKLIKKLKDLRLYDNSLIIITSDHGEAFGEKNLMEHGVSVYQDQVHVPLVVKLPNIDEGIVNNQLVSSVDIMPTILDMLGLDMPDDIDGSSLLRSETMKSRNIISESYPNFFLQAIHMRFHRVERAIFEGTYKFISSTSGKKEMYDWINDPGEKDDLYAAESVVSRKLEKKINEWVETVAAPAASTDLKIDQNTFERLRSLGYVQ